MKASCGAHLRTSRSHARPSIGGARAWRPQAHHVCLGRCADELHHRDQLSHTGEREVQALLAAPLHVIGKDIVRFHAVYWPAFLMSAGIAVPQKIFSHGFLFNRGEKMSKLVGNVIDPFAWPTLTASIDCASSSFASAVRPGWQLQPRRDHHPHQRRSLQRPRQPGAALAHHDRAPVRWRAAPTRRAERGRPRRFSARTATTT